MPRIVARAASHSIPSGATPWGFASTAVPTWFLSRLRRAISELHHAPAARAPIPAKARDLGMAHHLQYPLAQRLRLSPPRVRTLRFFCPVSPDLARALEALSRWPARFGRAACLGVLTVIASTAACGGAGASGPAASSASADPGDGGEASCEDRARTQKLCTAALTDRCQSQLNDCEATCETRGNLPGNTQKVPTNRGELESTRCRQDCRVGYDSCVRTLVPQCPRACE
jgi:hypothetical protein